VLGAFVALALGGLAFARVAPEQLRDLSGVGSMDRVEAPTTAEAPETVSEDAAREAREKAEREEREAREEAEEEKRKAEEKAAAEEREAEERAAEEQANREEGAAEEEGAGDDQYASGEDQYAAGEDQYGGEEESASGEVPATSGLYLTVPKMGISGDPVANGTDEATLMNGAGKLPASGYPWQSGSNVYIASHVYGYEGTGSWQHFAALPSMTYGDEIILTDDNGTEYRYAVSEILTVAPTDVWVTNPTGEDMVSLQTCVGPGWSERLVVRATRVS